MCLTDGADCTAPAMPPACPPAAQKLRIGISLGAGPLRAWEAAMLTRIRDSEYAHIVVAMKPPSGEGGSANPEVPTVPRRARGAFHGALHTLATALEAKITCERDAFASHETTGVLDGVETLEAESCAPALDVWVQLGDPRAGEPQPPARYGVWRLVHGEWSAHDAVAAGFWPVARDATTIESTLVSQGAAGLRIVASSVTGTNRFSVKLSRSALYWKTSSLLPRALETLHRLGPDALAGVAQQGESDGVLDAHRVPTTTQLAVHVARNVTRRARDFFHRHFELDRWVLLAHAGEEPCTRGHDFTSIVPPKDRFWADPHVVHKDGEYFVFVEEFTFARGKGHIAVLRLDEAGAARGPATTVLERDYHLSYPCVFEHAGEFFMIPESSENRTVDLYRCTDFPGAWEYAATLLKDIDAVDATVVEHEGRWWLFAGVRENDGASYNEELCIFHAASLLDAQWTPHAANPVISDVRRARPGGAMFRRGGKLYRPAQDCSERYGYAVALNEVTVLTPSAYAETAVTWLLPDWDPGIAATHTLAYTPGLTVIDALKPRLKL